MADPIIAPTTGSPEAGEAGISGRKAPSWSEVRGRVNALVEKRRGQESQLSPDDRNEIDQIRSDASEVFSDYFRRTMSTDTGKDILICINPELSEEDLEKVHGAYGVYLSVEKELESSIANHQEERNKKEVMRQNEAILKQYGLMDSFGRHIFVENLNNIFTFELDKLGLPVEYETIGYKNDLQFFQRISNNAALLQFFDSQLADRLANTQHLKDTAQTTSESDSESKAVARAIDRERFARVMPLFEDQCNDDTRMNQPIYHAREGEPKNMNEQQILRQFRDFLLSLPRTNAAAAEKIDDILDNLSFLGEKEFEEGCKGLAEYYKYYLETNKDAQLCIYTGISTSYARSKEFVVKSDLYVRDRILKYFTNEDFLRYKGRLVFSLDDISAPPEKLRIACPDEWMLSGNQQAGNNFMEIIKAHPEYEKCIELNTLVVSPTRIYYGLRYPPQSVDKVWTIPVKSYFMAHAAIEGETTDHNAHITGAYSAPDYFSIPFEHLVGDTLVESQIESGELTINGWEDYKTYMSTVLPAVIRLQRPYRSMTSLPEYERAVAILTGE